MDISTANESAPIDILSWLSKTTLDIIGLAGVCVTTEIYKLTPVYAIAFQVSTTSLTH